MDRRAQLQFMLLTADAQRSAIRRLALSGLNEDEIARATGWKAADVRGVLGPPVIPDFMTWAPRRNRGSQPPRSSASA